MCFFVHLNVYTVSICFQGQMDCICLTVYVVFFKLFITQFPHVFHALLIIFYKCCFMAPQRCLTYCVYTTWISTSFFCAEGKWVWLARLLCDSFPKCEKAISAEILEHKDSFKSELSVVTYCIYFFSLFIYF